MAAKRKRKLAAVLEPLHQRPGHIVTGEAFEEGRRVIQRRVQDALDRLWSRNAVTKRQYMAGDRLRADYMLGIEGARDSDRVGSGRPDWGLGDAQIAAIRSCKQAKALLGERRWNVTIMICAGITLAEVAKELRDDPKRVAGVLACSLDDLADAYGIPYDAARGERVHVPLQIPLDRLAAIR